MLYPLKFKPYLKPTVWGGEKICAFKGIDAGEELTPDQAGHIGESWEISGLKGCETVVADGELAGISVSGLTTRYKEALLGRKVYASTGEEFPLLIKFIDAKSDLSVQVHPDDALARKHCGLDAKGKTEMWYVIGAEQGSFLYNGLKTALSPEEYVRRISDNSITDVLARHEIAPGDVFFIPAGRIHSIGAGCFVAEIQQTSDITYRIYDYGRPGLDGKPRELHTELAREAIDYKVYDNYKVNVREKEDSIVEMADCPYFSAGILRASKPYNVSLKHLDSFIILICISGEAELVCSGDGISEEPVGIRQGETVLIPACAESAVLTPSGGNEVKLLTACIR